MSIADMFHSLGKTARVLLYNFCIEETEYLVLLQTSKKSCTNTVLKLINVVECSDKTMIALRRANVITLESK
jgi:hypothetical protein